MTFSLSGTTITQTGTDTDLDGLDGISGVTKTDRESHIEYFLSDRDLVIDGTLTIAADGTKEQLRFHDSSYTTNSIVINGTLNVGTSHADPLDYNYQDYIPAIQEDIGTVGYSTRNNQNGEGNGASAQGSVYVDGGTWNIYGRIVNVASFGTEASSGSTLVFRYAIMTKHSGATYMYESDVEITNSTVNTFALVSSSGYDDISNTKIIGEPFIISNDSPLNSVFTITGVPDTNGKNFVTAGKSSESVNGSTSPKAVAIDIENGTDQVYAVLSGRYWRAELKANVTVTVKDLSGTAITDAKVYYKGASGTETTASVDGSGEHSFVFLMATRAAENGTVNPYVFYTKNGDTTDDTIDVRTIAYSKTIGQSNDVSMRSITGTTVNSVIFTDSSITQTTKATVDAYTTIDNTGEFYDRAKAYLFDNYDGETETIVTKVGDQIDAGDQNVVIDATASQAFAFASGTPNTITIKSSAYTGDITTTGTITLSNGATVDGTLVDSTGTSVIIAVNVSDASDSSNIQNARVYVFANTGGALAAGTEIVNELTDSNGDVSERVSITPTQPATIRVRKTSASTYYKTNETIVSIGSAGIDSNVSLISDE